MGQFLDVQDEDLKVNDSSPGSQSHYNLVKEADVEKKKKSHEVWDNSTSVL